MKLQIIRWGIIGCGNVTEVKSGPAFQKAKNSELVAVMRRNGALAADYARRHKVPKWYDSAEKLINDPEVDAVYIATPPSSHKEYTILAARAGKPVYVEKPMALNYTECLEMMEVCRLANVPLFVAYYRRELPRFLKVKDLLSHDRIGKVENINITLTKKASSEDIKGVYNWRVDSSVSGGGYFYDLASHQIDLLQYFFGPVINVSDAVIRKSNYYNAEEEVTTLFEFRSGLNCFGYWNFNSSENIDKIVITGQKGSITFSTFEDEPVILKENNTITGFDIPNPEHIQLPFIQTLIDELTGNGKCMSNGISGSLTNKVIDSVFSVFL